MKVISGMECLTPSRDTSRGRGAGLRVLFAAAEIYPLAKTGGLADVCGALPKALAALSADVRMVMPAYEQAMDSAQELECQGSTILFGERVRLWQGRTPDSGLAIWLVDCPTLFKRTGTLYQDNQGFDWPDNLHRFAVFAEAAARMAMGFNRDSWRPDVVHAHDWHAGLVPFFLNQWQQPRPASLFTIHNAAFQGNFALSEAKALGIEGHALSPDGAEFYGRFSCLKAGIRYSDRISTVSPGYARELLTEEFGCGMQDLLRSRQDRFSGILNGIDSDVWNPAQDPHLSVAYSRPDCGGKAACKAELQRYFGLTEDPSAMLAISASRITTQKMADVLLESLPGALAEHPRLQVALIGQGDRQLEQGFIALGAQYPGRLAVRIGYEEALAHRMHAGADLLLHGSRFEPCGLAQLYAMRYGTLPLVRRVGGLADSVVDADDLRAPWRTGFIFEGVSTQDFSQALRRGIEAYEQRREDWFVLQRNAMVADFGWRRSATQYLQLYRRLSADRTGGAESSPPSDMEFGARAVPALPLRAAAFSF